MVTLPLEGVHMEIKRGQIWYADLSPIRGSEQGGLRPVVVVSNNKGNEVSPVIIVAPITSVASKKKLPTQVLIGTESGLKALSMVMCEQLRTIDKSRIKMSEPFGEVKPYLMAAIDKAIKVSLGV